MGGRGAAGGGKGSKPGRARKQDNTPFTIPKGLSRSVLKTFNRGQLEDLATAIFANEGMTRGLSKSEGITRARSMMSGNSTTQLIKYISKRAK